LRNAIALLILCLTISAARAQGPSYPYSGNLSWTPSSTSGCTGQNVYRAPYTTACGTFVVLPAGSNIGPALTSFADSTVANGGSYCYGVTAIGGNGKESALDIASSNPTLIPPAPPTNATVTVAKNANGTEDAIYAWDNPPGELTGNSIFCGAKKPSAVIVKVFFPTTKVRVTSPAGTNECAITATGKTGESGLSNVVKVAVP